MVWVTLGVLASDDTAEWGRCGSSTPMRIYLRDCPICAHRW